MHILPNENQPTNQIGKGKEKDFSFPTRAINVIHLTPLVRKVWEEISCVIEVDLI